MERKITVQQFEQLVSAQSGVSRDKVSAVLKRVFENISDGLVLNGESMLFGVGTFKKTEMEDGSNSVVLKVEKSLAQSVNAPFEAFSEVTLAAEYADVPEEQTENNPACIAPDNVGNTSSAESEVIVSASEAVASDTIREEVNEADNESDIDDEPPAVNAEDSRTEEDSEENVESGVTVDPEDEDGIQIEMPEIPPVQEDVTAEENLTPSGTMVPPPFNPRKAYTPADNACYVEEDEEEFVEASEQTQNGSHKFMNGLVCGVVIALGVVALLAVAYTFLL